MTTATDYQRTGIKTTDQLRPGDRVRIPYRGMVRTVREVVPSGWKNAARVEVLTVKYAEGKTPEWSEGNTGSPASPWTVVLPWWAEGGFCGCFDGQVALHDGHCCMTSPDGQCAHHDADITAWLAGQPGWPHTAEDGGQIWACCMSDVTLCGHRQADAQAS